MKPAREKWLFVVVAAVVALLCVAAGIAAFLYFLSPSTTHTFAGERWGVVFTIAGPAAVCLLLFIALLWAALQILKAFRSGD